MGSMANRRSYSMTQSLMLICLSEKTHGHDDCGDEDDDDDDDDGGDEDNVFPVWRERVFPSLLGKRELKLVSAEEWRSLFQCVAT